MFQILLALICNLNNWEEFYAIFFYRTSLMLAASRGYLDIVKLLLASSADASLKDSKGWSADDYASMSGHHP